MTDVNFLEFLRDIPSLLCLAGNVDESMLAVLSEIKKILKINSSAVYYFSENRAYLKYETAKNVFPEYISENYLSELKNSGDYTEIPELNINEKNQVLKFFAVPLIIKDTIFGFIAVLSKKNLAKAEVDILRAAASIAAYAIKDAELSDIFKLQLSEMQTSIVNKEEAVETVKEENKKILEADKIKNEFLANISHELRTPLNAIIGLSEVLNSKIFGELNDKQSEYVNDIYASGVHLLGMINEILDISKLEAEVTKITYSKFYAETAIGEVIRVMQPLADKKNIKISFKYHSQCEIKSDYQKFQQIFYNLVGNAVKFTQNGGSIDINEEINNGMLKISVRDNGIGIEKKYHDKIFDKFVQIETPYTKTGSSTGLGLTITKRFVEMLGGEIHLKSAKGKGSEFICSFPLK